MFEICTEFNRFGMESTKHDSIQSFTYLRILQQHTISCTVVHEMPYGCFKKMLFGRTAVIKTLKVS